MDDNFGLIVYHIEEFDDFLVPHPNAAMAGGAADLFFMVGAMDIDKPIKGVLVFRVLTGEPENACEYEIVVAGDI